MTLNPVPVPDPRRLAELLAREYGIEAAVDALGGQGANYRVRASDGERYVLKLSSGTVPEAHLDLEHAAVEHLVSQGVSLSMPRTVRTVNGALRSDALASEGVRARLLRWVEGVSWAEALPASRERLRAFGSALAHMDLAFTQFRHAAQARTHAWDLTNAGAHADLVAHVKDRRRRRILEAAFLRFRACAEPYLPELPRSFIHGDANDENVLVDGDRVVGLIDFGDALENPLICELAIALAYVLLDPSLELSDGAEVVAGYHAVRPLTALELEVLHPLLCARLAVSVALASDRRRVEGAPAAWFVSEDAAWQRLERLEDVDPVTGGRALGGRLAEWECQGAAPDELLRRRARVIGSSLSISYRAPLSIVRGRGQYLYDDRGRPCLDLVNNVCHVGHCHPHVVEAGSRQMAMLNTNTRYLHPALVDYAERLTATLPEPLRVCFFLNSGSEANELALRLARAATGRHAMLVVDGAYHGNTGRLIDISPYKFMGAGGSGAPGPDVHVVPAPDGYRGPHRGHDAATGCAYGDEVKRVIAQAGQPIAAFIAEPLLSCAGQIVPPPLWLDTAFGHVRAAGGICIVDEVQTGFGRVGSHFWGFETQHVVPDVVVMGKPMGNGHPLAAVVTSPDIARAFANGMEFFSTFGGNPVSCAIGLAVLDVIEREGLQARALHLGNHIIAGLRELAGSAPLIGDVRGAGLFIGVELVRDRSTLEPASAEADAVINRLRERGILLSTDGPHHNVLKVKPPLVLGEGDASMFIRSLGDVLADLRPD